MPLASLGVDKGQEEYAKFVSNYFFTKLMASTTHVFKMEMHCDGCPQRAEKLLKKLNGIESVTWDMKEQLLYVKVYAGTQH